MFTSKGPKSAGLYEISFNSLHAQTTFVGDTNHQCSKQRSSPKKETCDHALSCLVFGKNVGRESNHNPNKDYQRNKEILAHGNKFLGR